MDPGMDKSRNSIAVMQIMSVIGVKRTMPVPALGTKVSSPCTSPTLEDLGDPRRRKNAMTSPRTLTSYKDLVIWISEGVLNRLTR
jgi:hypothetical protein